MIPNHAGIIVCTEDFNRARQAEKIVDEISEIKNLTGILLRVYRPSL
jgi:hypothetical protein